MASIGGFFKSVLARPGQNAKNAQDERQASVGAGGLEVFDAAKPGVLNQIKYAGSLETPRQNLINDTLLLGTPGNLAASAKRQIGAIDSGLVDSTRMIGQQFDSAGLSDGAKGGAIMDSTNLATEAKNNVNSTINDPEYRMRLNQMLMGVINQGQQIPGLGALNAGASIVNGQAPVQVGNGIAEIAGGIAGQWANGGFKK